MIANRRTAQVKHANGDILHRTMIESVECPKNGEEARVVLHTILRLISETPELLKCNNMDFDSLFFKYVNGRWIVETQALEKGPDLTD